VNRNWAASHMDVLRRFVLAFNKSVDWFQDRRNRDEAIAVMAAASRQGPDEVAKSYEFFRNGEFFEPTGTVSKTKVRTVTKVLEDLGDLPGNIDLERLFLPGVTRVVE
jgi:ABC-type nitrate/sulfonate/bicarbonate transport system substrate-binding protein